jgi:CRISPR-associated protein Csb2
MHTGFSLKVELISGRYSAYSWESNRDQLEWPPHPARLYSALVSAYHRTANPCPKEREFLLWLEGQEAPGIKCSDLALSEARQCRYTTYVPANVSGSPRNAKTEVSFHPKDPCIYFSYAVEIPEDLREAADRVCSYVTYLGNSKSMASVSVTPYEEPLLIPTTDKDGPEIRVPESGSLGLLEYAYTNPNPSPSGKFLPYPRKVYGRKPVEVEEVKTPFTFANHFKIRRKEGATLSLQEGWVIADMIRTALCSYGDSPFISGHNSDGSVLKAPHLYVVPVAFVGTSDHADGTVKGFMFAWENGTPESNIREFYTRYAKWEAANTIPSDDPYPSFAIPVRGGREKIVLERTAGDESTMGKSLQWETWAKPSHVWHTVTPILIQGCRSQQVEDRIRQYVKYAGLPDPVSVEWQNNPFLRGSEYATRFSDPKEDVFGKSRKFYHVRLEFAQRVTGPMILGQGRYLGLGLFLPK